MIVSPAAKIFMNPVLISDDDEFFREALYSILKRKIGFPLVIQSSSFDEAVDRLEGNDQVGLALFDLNMPGMDNWVNLQTIRTSYPELQVAVVSASQNRQDILSALAIGMHGYVYKGLGIPEMEKALRQICEGTIYVPPIVAEVPPSSLADAGNLSGPLEFQNSRAIPNMTSRQKEILTLLVAGKSNKAMARALALSEGTVKFHMAAVFRVLGASNRVEAATSGSQLLRALNEQSLRCD